MLQRDDEDLVAPDAVLVRRAALGDRAAFAGIFHRHAAAMFGYALHMLDGDIHEAEDAVQTALIKAWRNMPGFRGESALRTWLLRITANEVLAARRRRRPVLVTEDLLTARPSEPDGDPAQQVGRAELWEALALALAELPWRQRACWLLRHNENLSYAEIADILQTTPTVVRGQLHRARRTLAVRMAQWR